MGIKPSRPDTGYGIKYKGDREAVEVKGLRKPNLATAEKMLGSWLLE